MKELIIAFGLFLFIEGIIYALFPSKMKNMLKKMETIKDSQLRIGGLVFAVIGFLIIWLKLMIAFPNDLVISDAVSSLDVCILNCVYILKPSFLISLIV